MKKTRTPYLFGLALLWANASLPAQTTQPAKPTDSDQVVELSPFVVSSSSNIGSGITETTTGTLVSRPIGLMPMALSVVSDEMLKEVGIFNGDGLSRIVPGMASQTNTSTNGDGNNTLYTLRGFGSYPRLNGFAPGGRLFDMTDIDRVEVIKGPNSLLYGQSDPGGIINYVTKRPRLLNEVGVRGTVTAAYGNYDFYRGQTDVDYTLVPGKLGFRLPASYTDYRREFQWWRSRTTALGPSFLWRIFPKTEISGIYEWFSQKINFGTFQPIVWTPPGGTEFVSKNRRGLGRDANFVFGPYSTATNKQANWMIDLTSLLTDHITFRAAYSKNNRDRNEIVPTGGDPFRVVPLGYRAQQTIDGNAINGYKADLLGQWDIGKFTTRTILGYEYNENDYFAYGYQTNNILYTINVGFDPVTGLGTRVPTAAEYMPLDQNLQNPAYWHYYINPARYRSKWTNMRLSEVLSAFDDRLQLLGGVARGHSVLVNLSNSSQQAQSANLYQIGLGAVLDKAKHHMLFANQSISYVPQFLFDIDNNPLPPMTGFGLEGGIKSTWGDTGLFTTLTVFNQKRTNIGRQYTDPLLNRTYAVLTPGEEAKGWEGEFWYRLHKQLELHGAYTEFNGRVTGVQPGKEFLLGRELPRSPGHAATLFSTYTFNSDQKLLNGLRLGAGATYKSSTWLDTGQGQNTLNTRRSDAAWVYWIMLSKEFKLTGPQVLVLRLNVGNLLNKEYISEGNTYGEPRLIRFAVDYKF